jgi:hypothetical protein
MLPELTEFVSATRMGIVRKVLLGLKIRASRGSIGFTQKIYYFVKLLLLDIALFE